MARTKLDGDSAILVILCHRKAAALHNHKGNSNYKAKDRRKARPKGSAGGGSGNNMPCPRCAGLVVTQYEETHCLQCGWYLNDPLPTPYVSPRVTGSNACKLCGAMRTK